MIKGSQGDLYVRETGSENPIPLIQSTSIQDLDDDLNVGRVKKPKITGICGEAHGMTHTGQPVGCLPLRLDAEPPSIKAKSVLVRLARSSSRGRHDMHAT
jgi:hypothetical protein